MLEDRGFDGGFGPVVVGGAAERELLRACRWAQGGLGSERERGWVAAVEVLGALGFGLGDLRCGVFEVGCRERMLLLFLLLLSGDWSARGGWRRLGGSRCFDLRWCGWWWTWVVVARG